MNPDLMITIVFSLLVLLLWGVWGALFARSVRNEETEDAATKRLDAAGATAEAIRQPRPTRAAGKLRRASTATGCGSRPGHPRKSGAAPSAGACAGKRWET